MLEKLELLCSEILSFSDSARESILIQIKNDTDLPPAIKNILSFLITNARGLICPSSPSGRQECAHAHIPATQEVHQ